MTVGALARQRTEKVLPARADATPYVALENISSGSGQLQRVGESGTALSHKTRFVAGDTLFGKLRPNLRKVARAPFDGVCSTDIIVVAARTGTDSRYLYHLLGSDLVYRHAMGDLTGTKMPRSSWERLSAFSFLCPPVTEQRAIARVLDAIDEVIERAEAGLTAVERLYEALLDELLSRGPAGRHSQWKEVAGLGKVPACWESTTVGACLRTGPTNGIYKPTSDRGTGVVLIRILDFGSGRMYRRSGFDRVQATVDETRRYEVKAGDILLNRVNSGDNVAKAVLFPDIGETAVFESNMMRLRANGKVNPRFLEMHLVSSRARTHFRARTKKAVQQASVNQQDVVSLPIALPSLAEQAAICAAADSVRHLDDQTAVLLRGLRAAQSAMTESLLAGRVRVPNLVPRGGLDSDAVS